jgi:beta-lactam-binding protein with PASTA domain
VFGTAAYVSPEQAQGDTVDRRTDVYSLGCVLYELLAGRQPFSADSPVALAYQHVSATPPPPSQFSDEATDELDAITLKAMAKDVDDRYQTAREFNADLERARAGVPVTAPMVGAWAATRAVDGWDDQTVASTPAAAGTYPADDDWHDDGAYEEEPRRNRAGWIIATILLLLALLAGGWWLFTALTGDQVQTETLPDVTGEQEEVAIERLSALGFTDVSVERTAQSDVPQGEVFEQDPQASDEQIPLDTPIALTVSSGPEQVQVPDVTGRNRQQASRQLRQANLAVGNVTQEDSDDVPQGQVIRTDPPAGDEVDQGTEVDLVISRGSRTAQVPDVTNLPVDDATLRIEGACEPRPCFGVSTIDQSNPDVAEGSVIRQSPDAGSEQPKGSTVTLVVSTGPAQQEQPEPSEPQISIEVPDVVGMPAEDAVTALQQAGLQIGDVSEESSDSVPAGAVISTDPDAGTEVGEQEPVALVVSTGPPTSGDAADPGTTNNDAGGNGGGNAGGGAAVGELLRPRRQ